MNKDEEKLARMQKGGRLLATIRETLLSEIKVGTTGQDIDQLADKLIKKAGGEPSFKMVPGYRWATCICTNDIVVHGVPTIKPFVPGDVVGIDVGMYYQGFHTDTAWTVAVESRQEAPLRLRFAGQAGSRNIDEFLKTGEQALNLAIDQARVGNHVGHISKAIQHTIEQAGFSVVRSLVGHGVGRKLHEEPEIPGFLKQKIEETPRLKLGMTMAIEVIYAYGKPDIVFEKDGWTIRTKDGKIAGLVEQTVAISQKGPLILT